MIAVAILLILMICTGLYIAVLGIYDAGRHNNWRGSLIGVLMMAVGIIIGHIIL